MLAPWFFCESVSMHQDPWFLFVLDTTVFSKPKQTTELGDTAPNLWPKDLAHRGPVTPSDRIRHPGLRAHPSVTSAGEHRAIGYSMPPEGYSTHWGTPGIDFPLLWKLSSPRKDKVWDLRTTGYLRRRLFEALSQQDTDSEPETPTELYLDIWT